MGLTEKFLVIWMVSAVAWELVSLATRWWEPISPVLSRLPVWAILVIMIAWSVLITHWWYFGKSAEYRALVAGAFQ